MRAGEPPQARVAAAWSNQVVHGGAVGAAAALKSMQHEVRKLIAQVCLTTVQRLCRMPHASCHVCITHGAGPTTAG